MNNIFLFLIFISFISCKPQSKNDIFSAPAYNVHPEIEPYVKTFSAKMKLAGINKSTNHLQASFSDDLTSGEAGRCIIKNKNGESIKKLLLSRYYWDQMVPEDREEIVYHELGHCILERKTHPTNLNSDGQPASIMYPTHIGNVLYLQYYGEYMAELFSNSSQEMLDLEFDDSTY